MKRAAVLAGIALLTWALGPLVVVLALLSLSVPRVRHAFWYADPLLPWGRLKAVGAWVGLAVVLALVAWAIPDGVLPLPSGPGVLVGPDYTGSPATPHPIMMERRQNPHLAPNDRNSMHDDAGSSDAYGWPGPIGDQPSVASAWYGLEECATLAWDSHDRLIGLCGDLRGPRLHVIDPKSMRFDATMRLPGRRSADGKPPWENLCAGAYFYLDNTDRAIVATTDRRIVAVKTSDGTGKPDLSLDHEWNLARDIPESDCLVAVLPDWLGRIWFETQDGLVGWVAPQSGLVRTIDLGATIANSFSIAPDGGVFVVTTEAAYRLDVVGDGKPTITWQAPYDRGAEQKPGQLSQGSGTTPTLIDGRVAITDNADPQMFVLYLDQRTGRTVCRAPVFASGASDTENSLVAVGDGVVVENNYGYAGPQSTILGRTTEPGLAKVSLDCHVDWTTDVSAPTSVAKVSLATGLVYAITKPHSWLGVDAWYLTAVDSSTGHVEFTRRLGTGPLFNNHYAAVTLSPSGALYVATLGGLIRVTDRP